MKKIKVYVYKNFDNAIIEYTKKQSVSNLSLIGTRTITLDAPEEKPERLRGFIRRTLFGNDKVAAISKDKWADDDTSMIEIREGEIIVSEDQVRDKLKHRFDIDHIDFVIRELFKKEE